LERPDLYVVARFLDAFYSSEQPLKKTNVQMKVGLNYTRFQDYMDWLLAQGLVQRSDEAGAEVYGLSPKGLDSYHKLVGWIRDTLHQSKI
jgi:predicted transcriptional regulator